MAAGYTNVRRYQLGIPVWRALVGVTEIELAGLLYVLRDDKTAVFLDARGPEEFKAGTIPGAKSLPLADVKKAKDDGDYPWRTTTRASSFLVGTALKPAQ